NGETSMLRDRLLHAAPAEQLDIMERFIVHQVARVLQTEPPRIDRNASFMSLGVDSFVAIKVSRRIGDSLDLRVPQISVFTYDTLATLSRFLVDEFLEQQKTAPTDAEEFEELTL